MKTRAISFISAVLLTTGAFAADKTFQIVTDKLSYRNVATVESESDFETFTGKTSQVNGTIKYDPAKKTGSGFLEVDVASIDTGIPLRNDHMKSESWMNVAKYPKIRFESTKVEQLSGDAFRIVGKLTMHGVTRNVSATARVRYRAADADTKKNGFDGDVLQITSKIDIKLSDYGVKIPDFVKNKVSNDLKLSISTYAVAPANG